MFNLNAVYWTLSTVAQTLVALVAFVGLVAVWRLQVLGRQRAESWEVLIHLWQFISDIPSDRLKDDDLVKVDWAELEKKSQLDSKQFMEARIHSDLLVGILERRRLIQKSLAWLATFGIAATSFALGLLTIAMRLVGDKHHPPDLEEYALGAFLILAVLVAATLGTAYRALRESFKE